MTRIFQVNIFEPEGSIEDTLNNLNNNFNAIHFTVPNRKMDKEQNDEALQKCIAILEKIPDYITIIDFSGICNSFGDFSSQHIISFFDKMPSNIERLVLNASYLEQCSSTKRQQILKNLPANVTHLVLSDGSLKNTFTEGICTLPTTIRSLSLDKVALKELPLDNLKRLSQRLEAVILSDNMLNKYNPDEVALILSKIESNQLLLPNNNLTNFGIKNLKIIFSTISPKVSVIDLQNNGLFAKSTKDFKQLNNLLPNIELVYINLEGKKANDVQKHQTFKAIFSKTTTSIFINQNGEVDISGESNWSNDKALINSIVTYVKSGKVLSNQSIEKISPRDRTNRQSTAVLWKQAQPNTNTRGTMSQPLFANRSQSTGSESGKDAEASSFVTPPGNQ